MSSMQIVNDETQHTSIQSHIYVDNKKIYQLTDSYRDLHSIEQVEKVIDNLVINNGFVLNLTKPKEITLTHPKDSAIAYNIWLDTFGINKRTTKLVGKVDM